MSAFGDRARYEAAVRALRKEADALLADGVAIDAVAIAMVVRRNALKRAFRVGMDPTVLALIQARNTVRYGDPVGPTATMLFERYGDWLAVIDAACRPARLSDGS